MFSIATVVLVMFSAAAAPDQTASDRAGLTRASAAQPAEQGGAGQSGGAPAERPRNERRASVEGTMKIMDRAMEPLINQISDPAKRDENLGYVNEMQRGCVIGKGLPLPKEFLAKAGDEAAQAKILKAYHAHMLSLLKKLISLEEAIYDGKLDDAKKCLDEVIQERDSGHAAMEMPDENVSPFYPK
jgi:hypothetical protein